MQKWTLQALCVVLSLQIGWTSPDDKDDVLKADNAIREAELHNDVAALDRLLADDFIEINQWGVVRDKRGTIQLFKTFHMSSQVPADVSVRVSGDAAIVVGNMFESGRERYLFLENFVKRRGDWQVFSVVHSFRVDAETLKVTGQGAESGHPVTGRLYAGMMGMSGADWLTRPDREKKEQPDKAIEALAIAPGSTVADIGAGVGYFSWRLAKAVGPTGRVYANEIQSGMIEKIRKNMAERSISNVEPLLGTADDPMLPKEAVDLALMVDVYHELAEPKKMLRHTRDSLKPEGRLVLIEYRKEDNSLPMGALHSMSVNEAKAEIEPEGFRFEKVLEILPDQHIIIFKLRPN